VPAALREAARRDLAVMGAAAFHARLAEADPVMAGRLAEGDSQRLLRAWEVLQATGRSLAEWQAAPTAPAPYRCRKLCLLPPREAIYAACDARLEAMLEQGLLDEVAALLALKLDPALPVMKAVGVPEFAEFLAGRTSREAALARAQQATRRYAKRQLTWLRHQYVGNDSTVLVIRTQYSESLKADFFAKIRQNLLTG
jgi:tRNA dimethylallyltransferase